MTTAQRQALNARMAEFYGIGSQPQTIGREWIMSGQKHNTKRRVNQDVMESELGISPDEATRLAGIIVPLLGCVNEHSSDEVALALV